MGRWGVCVSGCGKAQLLTIPLYLQSEGSRQHCVCVSACACRCKRKQTIQMLNVKRNTPKNSLTAEDDRVWCRHMQGQGNSVPHQKHLIQIQFKFKGIPPQLSRRLHLQLAHIFIKLCICNNSIPIPKGGGHNWQSAHKSAHCGRQGRRLHM